MADCPIGPRLDAIEYQIRLTQEMINRLHVHLERVIKAARVPAKKTKKRSPKRG